LKFTELSLNGACAFDLNKVEVERGFIGRLWYKTAFENLNKITQIRKNQIVEYSKLFLQLDEKN